jgi:hypothetical protein
MISIVMAPPGSPQVSTVHAPTLAGIEHPLAGEVLNAVRQHGAIPVRLWGLINSLAVARPPDYRARLRCWRLRYWGAVRELLKAKLLYRHGPIICSTDFATRPKSGSRPRSNQPLVSPSVGASNSKTSGSNAVVTPDKTSRSGVQALETQIVGENQGPPTSAWEPKSAVPTAAEITAAARALARRCRKPKRWTGWLHGKRMWRLKPVVVPGGRTLQAYVVRRGWVYVALPNTPEHAGRFFDLYRAEDVQIAKDPHATILGSLKAGRKERPSLLKQQTARLNGIRRSRLESKAK